MNRQSAMTGLIAALLVLGSVVVVLAAQPERKSQFTSVFAVNKANFVSVGRNPYFILEPGYRLHFKADDATLTVTVLDKTKVVDGVETRVVEERETEGGQLVEVSRNYFAFDKTTNAVYYFGEDVDMYKGGKVVGHGGAWLSGVDGAGFGMMMPGAPKVGDKFYQELAPKVAMDRCEVVGLRTKIKTPAGEFTDCPRTKETSPLERGASVKVYAPGVGMVRDDEFLLEKVERPSKATLVQALEDWIILLEANNTEAAQKRWANDTPAADQMKQWWAKLAECRKQYDYRKWLDGAKQIGDAKEFKVGGHDYGHMHVDWKKTDQGWRIAKVWICR